MRTIIAVTALALLGAVATAAGERTVSSDLNVTLTQNAYSDNWEGSESGAISWATNWNSMAEAQLNERIHNKHTLKLAFGQTHSQDRETKKWQSPVKSTDLADYETVFRFTYGWFVDPFVSAGAASQFLDESDSTKTRYLNPTTIREGFGVAKVLLTGEDKEWTVRLGGGLRQRIDRDAISEEDSDVRGTVTTESGGVEFVSEFHSPFAGDRLTATSKLTLYRALYSSESDALEGTPEADDWEATDVDWENTLTASITKYLMVNLYVRLLYDREIDDEVRFKETLSLGFTFKLS